MSPFLVVGEYSFLRKFIQFFEVVNNGDGLIKNFILIIILMFYAFSSWIMLACFIRMTFEDLLLKIGIFVILLNHDIITWILFDTHQTIWYFVVAWICLCKFINRRKNINNFIVQIHTIPLEAPRPRSLEPWTPGLSATVTSTPVETAALG